MNRIIGDTEIISIKYMSTSRNANPRFMVTLAAGETLATQIDGSIGYGIENPECQGRVDVTVNGRGHIVDVTPVKGN